MALPLRMALLEASFRLGGQMPGKQPVPYSPGPAPEPWDAMFMGKVVYSLVKLCLTAVPHLQTGAVFGNPEI
jgi:hypothetical protein